MHVTSFPCPHCSTTLRIRDRMHVGRQVHCPECGGLLRIVADGPTGFAAEAAKPPKPKPTAPPSPPKTTPDPTRGRLAHWKSRLLSPVGIGWMVAGALGLGLIGFLNFGGEDRAGQATELMAAGSPAEPVDPPVEEPAEKPAPPMETAEQRLEWIGRQLAAYHDRQGHFPTGTVNGQGADRPPADRFSWLATLVRQSPEHGTVPPWWDQPWHSPANDRFVRRSLPELLNPALPQKADENRYPATHYVGVAGVGADAPTLPVNHPRAGVFGVDRPTRREDIKDGTANTLAVAAVTGRLGAWAAGGAGTVRPFTQEPYINGPDGFGSPEGQGLPVLMADGRVRLLSPDTDPRLIRRMAAMSDGLPLDASVPGEPGDPPPAAPPPASPDPPPPPPVVAQEKPPAPPKADRPRTPAAIIAELLGQPAPKPPEQVNIKRRLEQPIARFEQIRPVAARQLLLQIEEMCGVPIRYDAQELAAIDWQKPVTLRLENTTVGDILAALLEQLAAHYVLEADTIRLHPGPAGSRAP